jgi:hypothetical protein
MQLPGSLAASTLGDLLGILHRGATTGSLELSEGGPAARVHRIHLAHGLVTGVETPLPSRPLGEVLRAAGFVAPEAVTLFLRHASLGDPRLTGEILVAMGAVSATVVAAALRAQLRERLDAIFAIAEARVAFRPARPAPPNRRSGPLSPRDFLFGRARARDRRRESWRESWRTRRAAGGWSEAAGHASRAEPSAGRAAPSAPLDREREAARALLGVRAGASIDDVRRAFRRLAGELHPDRCAHLPLDEQRRRSARLVALSAAYHRLV